MSGDSQPTSFGRREALKKLVTGAAAALPTGAAMTAARSQEASRPPAVPVRPPSDPDLFAQMPHWEKILTTEERRTASALCNTILPADDISISASDAGVPDFIDEWVSAPYPPQMADREIVRGGLAWINTESVKRFEKPFADLSAEQRTAICDDICHAPDAKPEFAFGARFFALFRDLTTSGFYTTEHGRNDLGYIGNVPLASFDGPPVEVLRHLGLA
jgi:gluconate 2-dehydrogenase gamma chain